MKKSFAILILTFACLQASAQGLPSLLIPGNTRSLSMAGADVALSPFDGRSGCELYLNSWAPQTASNTYFGTDMSFNMGESLALLVEGRYMKSDPMDITSDVGVIKSTFSPSEMMAGLGLAYRTSSGFTAGLKGRFVNSVLYESASGSAFACDLFARYSVDSFKAGLSLCNLGSKISYGGDAYSLPAVVKAGAAYEFAGLTACAELDYLLSGGMMLGLGAEYNIKDIAFVRAGYHYGDAEKVLPSFSSFGAGVRFFGAELNLCYLTASETLSNSIMLGLAYTF